MRFLTAGPWEASGSTVTATVETSYGPGILVVAECKRGVEVSGTVSASIDQVEARANARLIAAVPELMFAVQEVARIERASMAHSRDRQWYATASPGEWRHILKCAHAALVKATGGRF